jgi:hypothetical protein
MQGLYNKYTLQIVTYLAYSAKNNVSQHYYQHILLLVAQVIDIPFSHFCLSMLSTQSKLKNNITCKYKYIFDLTLTLKHPTILHNNGDLM